MPTFCQRIRRRRLDVPAFDCRNPVTLCNWIATGRDVVGDHPLSQFLRVKQLCELTRRASRVFPECRRKENGVHLLRQIAAIHKFAGKIVIAPTAEHKLDFHPGR